MVWWVDAESTFSHSQNYLNSVGHKIGVNRRTLLASLGVLSVSSLSGCLSAGDTAIPAGSLQFENQDDLPHIINTSVVDIGTETETDAEGYSVSGDVTVRPQQQTLTASSSVAPDETQVFNDIFTESVYYLVEFTLSNGASETGVRVPFHPSPSNREYDNILRGVVHPSGQLSWMIDTTDNPGRFG
jgi:hypothetical protein